MAEGKHSCRTAAYRLIDDEKRSALAEDKLRIAMISAHSCPVGTLGTKDTGGMSGRRVMFNPENGEMISQVIKRNIIV